MRALPPSDQLHHQIERAWYLLTVLLRLGRPARPLELDSDPDLVEYLCQIHGSPLFLDDNGFVTVSGSAISCFCQFWSNLSSPPVFSTGARVFANGSRRDQVGLVYVGKRKARGYERAMPVSKKRRLLIGCERDVEELGKDQSKFIQPVETSIAEKLEKEHAGNLLALCNIPLPEFQNAGLASNHHVDNPLKIQDKRVNCISLKKKIKGCALETKLPNETNVNDAAKTSKSQIEPKQLPNFEAFTIEEEEGSGGYGTVYKAKRKSDGKIFAVKCPHPNANSHHVKNEMKMLEWFGGRNFVIKYEGSFKSGSSECFLLEHVEHDRPEILKKEISIHELRWYGFCLFKALASLHNKGIAHRDVKPGNFLFSRKLNKGYLIDFNLASDLHQIFLRNATRADPAHTSATMSNAHDTKDKQSQILKRKRPTEKPFEASTRQAKSNYSQKTADGSGMTSIKDLTSTKTSRDRQREAMTYSKKAADASGVTSIKDLTSTRTSQERRKQPIVYQGLRKELVHFIKDTTQGSPNKEAVGPSLQRKRVTAPPMKNDTSLVIFTPMPLCSGGAAIAGSGVHKSKGEGKHRKEGPCAGTKGFRAPEVLFKSFHQSCKIDLWSAGVTLLYMIVGKSPFGGDPEQNIKEIAKLRGSEDLWEVAKLHNCECSFPKELFEVQHLQSMNLKYWCEINTRRPEFIKAIPDSLFDLIDKCLTVNPRCRVSAEEALAHNFFVHCHESLRKQRLVRKSSQPASTQGLS